MGTDRTAQDVSGPVERYLAQGWSCAQCLLKVLEKPLGIRKSNIVEATAALGHGRSRVCGLLPAGLLALGLVSAREEKTPTPRPSHQWLDAVATPTPAKLQERTDRFRRWFEERVQKPFGSLECHTISGMDSEASPATARLGYQPQVCAALVRDASAKVLELVGQGE